LSSEEKNEEITVKAPSKSAVSAEKQYQKTVEKSLEEERFKVLQFPKKISRYIGVTVIATGFLLVILFIFMSITGETGSILVSSGSGSLSLGLWVFVGLLNIILGFLFLGRE
jgi:small-conductance mechanosensitive channel